MTIFYILVGIAFGYIIVNLILDYKAPKESIKSVLVDKYIDTFVDANNVVMDRYMLFFKIKGKKKAFEVSYNKYMEYEVNQEGTLTYKRNRFVDFVPNNK